jgi:hypothetical protein
VLEAQMLHSKKVKSLPWKWNLVFALILCWFLIMVMGWFYLLPHEQPSQAATDLVQQTIDEKNEPLSVLDLPLNSEPNIEKIVKINNEIPPERELIANTIPLPLPHLPLPPLVVPIKIPPSPSPEQQVIKPKLRTADMWKMSVQEQRQYLQSLHDHEPEPGLQSSIDFISYAKESFKEENRNNLSKEDPVNRIWPQIGTDKTRTDFALPGHQRVPYHIAGKDVKLPYGYPEETIFILTASYRDPEVASTIARAYAR